MRRPVGIRGIAESAGVSVGTVSRVINHHPAVALEIRERVQRIIDKAGYTPDVFAQSMRRKTSKTIGIVIPDLQNPFFAQLVEIVEIAVRKQGYNVYFMSSAENLKAELSNIASLANRKVDAILLAPSIKTTKTPDTHGIPVIVIDRVLKEHTCVAADHRGGARTAVEYLLSLGHERIGCISGPTESVVAQERLAGFLDVMRPRYEPAGLRYEDFVLAGEFNYVFGRRAAETLLASPRSERPTAIFAGSDQQAIGALRAAADLGIPVPQGVSIIGFDGIPLSDHVTPRLSTIAQPVAEMAEAIASLLLNPRSEDQPVETLRLPCRLIKRESCAPPLR
jgi:LacI family transcriptional regulator